MTASSNRKISRRMERDRVLFLHNAFLSVSKCFDITPERTRNVLRRYGISIEQIGMIQLPERMDYTDFEAVCEIWNKRRGYKPSLATVASSYYEGLTERKPSKLAKKVSGIPQITLSQIDEEGEYEDEEKYEGPSDMDLARLAEEENLCDVDER
ncbi:hypothetical protein HYW76_00515 [Candidatus Pacearchaeota archaeon]|nr:hypothetical protein [Candidatus Pacearchaeota archaeon]